MLARRWGCCRRARVAPATGDAALRRWRVLLVALSKRIVHKRFFGVGFSYLSVLKNDGEGETRHKIVLRRRLSDLGTFLRACKGAARPKLQ